MFKRWFVIGLIVIGAALALGLNVSRVTAEAGTPCRRLVGADEWTRRCAPQRADEDFTAYCRRVDGTDEWTRRCLPQRPDEDYTSYCRRLYGTEAWTRRCAPERPNEDWQRYCRRIWETSEWTRRCLNMLTPTATPTTRPTDTHPVVVTAQPTNLRPTDLPSTVPVNPATPTPRGGRP